MVDISKLSWFLPENEQNKNIARIDFLSDADIVSLILPYGQKECWMNCAVVLSGLEDARLVPFLPKILEWYKDLNWPGIEVIHRRLQKLSVQQINAAVNYAIHQAKKENDEEWHDNLSSSFPGITS